MRKLFVLFVIGLLALYCWKAYSSYTYVSVPDYEDVQVDLLGGMSRSQWADDPTHRRETLNALSQRRLHPPAGGISLGDGRTFPTHRPLDTEALKDLIQHRLDNHPGNLPLEPLRDPAALYALEGNRYHLRDPLPEVTYQGEALTRKRVSLGIEVKKDLIDELLDAGIDRVAVVGSGKPVEPQPGTMILIMLIVLALTVALTDLFWDPILALMDERHKATEDGSRLARENRIEAKEVEKEGKELRAQARREYLDRLSGAQREARKEADEILSKARVEAHELRLKANADLADSLRDAEAELRKEIPGLAKSIVQQLAGSNTAGSAN